MDEFVVAFPNGSVVCAPGDHLICHDSGAGWRVYLVEDLLLVKRLVPVLDKPSMLMIEEHLPDSVPPAYFNDVHLLVTAFDPTFADAAEALHALDHQAVTERAKGLLRPAREFVEPACRVVGHVNAP